MKFAADITPADADPYHVENNPADVVRWEAQKPSHNVEALKKLTSIMEILHVASVRQGLTGHKGFSDWLDNLDGFDMAEVAAADPTNQEAPDEQSSPSLQALG